MIRHPSVAWLIALLQNPTTRNIVAGAVLGAILSGLITIFLDWRRRPRLKVNIERPPLDRSYPFHGRENARYLRVKVANQPRLGSAPALQCRGRITFHHELGGDVFGRAMDARWSSSPQPIGLEGMIVDTGLSGHPKTGAKILLVDPDRLVAPSRVHIYGGESETMDIAVRFNEDPDCFGWNNDAYFHEWRNPDWRLPAGRYLVRVEITSSAKRCVDVFRLVNDVPRMDCRLVPVRKRDKRLVESAPEDQGCIR